MIRKISIGPDYKNAMHYTVGQTFGRATLDTIRKVNSQHYEIYMKNDVGEVFLWKEVINMPVVPEYDNKAFS